jgi:hypothetical protein
VKLKTEDLCEVFLAVTRFEMRRVLFECVSEIGWYIHTFFYVAHCSRVQPEGISTGFQPKPTYLSF